MAFTDPEKAQIRKWLGFPAIFHFRDPRLESAIDAVSAIEDGGATEDEVQALLVKLAAIETKIEAALDCLGTVQVDKIMTDNARAIAVLESRGRKLCGRLSVVLGLNGFVMRDAFSSAELQPGGSEVAAVRGLGGWP
jgi:hypothetical protein